MLPVRGCCRHEARRVWKAAGRFGDAGTSCRLRPLRGSPVSSARTRRGSDGRCSPRAVMSPPGACSPEHYDGARLRYEFSGGEGAGRTPAPRCSTPIGFPDCAPPSTKPPLADRGHFHAAPACRRPTLAHRAPALRCERVLRPDRPGRPGCSAAPRRRLPLPPSTRWCWRLSHWLAATIVLCTAAPRRQR